MFDDDTTTCGDTPTYHFTGITGTRGWTQCLIDNGLNVYDNSSGVIDTFCFEDDDSIGMRVRGGLSEDAKIGIGVGVGVGGFLLLLSWGLLAYLFVKQRRRVGKQVT